MSDLYDGPVIDAHHHLWDLETNLYPWLEPGTLVPHRYGDYSAIKRSYRAADYLADIAGQGVVASVYMEAEWDPSDPLGETRYLHDVHAETGVPGAMVAQAWLDAPDAAEVLAAQAAFPLVRSVRHKPGGPTLPQEVQQGVRTLMSDDAWRAGYARLAEHGLHFDLQTPWWNLPEAAELARDFPETTLVVNHSGVIASRDEPTLADWREALRTVAAVPNTVIKASGLCVEGREWATEDQRGPILDMVEIFGADRVMFGSNFPVDGMFVDYAGLVSTYRDVLAALAPEQQRAVFHGTAERVYRPRSITAG